MKNTEIVFILDKSGSMSHLTNDTIGGFNGFIASQKALDGKATVTTVLFDTTWKMLHDGIDIQEVKTMTTTDYIAGGGTAMLDAIGETINRVQDRHDELGAEKPEEVLFVITTDGEENSSRSFTKKQIEKMIKHQTNGHGWKFMFLGANMDAVKEAASIGINSNYATNYDHTAKGIADSWTTMSVTADCLRNATISDDFNLSSTYNSVADNCMCTDVIEAKAYTDKISDIDLTLKG